MRSRRASVLIRRRVVLGFLLTGSFFRIPIPNVLVTLFRVFRIFRGSSIHPPMFR